MVSLEWWPTWKDKSSKVLLQASFENNETTKNREKVKISLTFAKIFVLIDTNLWIEFGFFTKFPIIVQKLKRDIWLITGETDNQTHLLRNLDILHIYIREVGGGGAHFGLKSCYAWHRRSETQVNWITHYWNNGCHVWQSAPHRVTENVLI